MRKYLRTIILLWVFQGFSLLAPGQGNNLLLGDKAFENLQYGPAIEYYVKALKDFTGGIQQRNELVYKLAECFRITNNPRRAEMYYQQLVRNKYADQKPLVYLYYAQSLLTQGRYPDALAIFKQYLLKVPGDAMALAGQASCELGIREKGSDKNWQVKKIPEINTPYDDFAAAYADAQYNTLIFSSNRKGTTGKETDSWTNGYFSDLFLATMKKGDLWTTPVLAEAHQGVNTEANEGVVSFGDQYRKLYFTRCGKMEKGKEYCQILESERKENGWGDPKVIYSDSLGNVGHPVLTADGLTMIFSSNRPGGYGSKDLWKTVRTSEHAPFGTAVNLGPEINTSGDEMFPSLLEDTVLYFASNGRAGFGGLDIYKTTMGMSRDMKVEHLPQPVNSFADDFAISFEGNSVKGFFSSRRAGGKGGDDVYAFERLSGKATLKVY